MFKVKKLRGSYYPVSELTGLIKQEKVMVVYETIITRYCFKKQRL